MKVFIITEIIHFNDISQQKCDYVLISSKLRDDMKYKDWIVFQEKIQNSILSKYGQIMVVELMEYK